MDQLFLGLLLLNTETCGFSTSGREELVFFLWGNVPSETGTMLFFGEKHLQRCLSPTEGTPKLEIREPPGASPSAAPCSWITLGMGWDGMERTGTPCPHPTGSLCHLVVLGVGPAQAVQEEEFSEHEDE